ncbi:class I SAM-dependent methyltransferase [Phycicoccus ginsengisoli]
MTEPPTARDWSSFLDHDYSTGEQTLDGVCPICDAPTAYLAHGPWLRDLLVCPTCAGSSVPRERAIARVIEWLYPHWRSLTIHEAAPAARGSSAWLASGASALTTSKYDPDLPLGVRQGDWSNENLEALTLPDSSVDLLVHTDVLEHVNRPDLVMREAARVLRPGGACIFTTPTFGHLATTTRRAIYHPDGTVEHLLPPEYHGSEDPGRAVLVTFHFGHDLPELILRWSGMSTDVIRTTDPRSGVLGQHTEVYVCRPA